MFLSILYLFYLSYYGDLNKKYDNGLINTYIKINKYVLAIQYTYLFI